MNTGSFCKRLTDTLIARGKVKKGLNGYFSAAVMVPLVFKDSELAVLFEVRSAKMVWQPGEICFPGGRIDAADASPKDAAIREISEELGINSNCITVLGQLQQMVSPIGVLLYPFAGFLDTGEFNPNQDEVAEVFTVPLKFLLATEPRVGHLEASTRPLADFPFDMLPGYPKTWRRRTTYQVYFYQYKEYIIWGLTAEVLKQFLDVCHSVPRV